jgi:hypothetical protein
MAGKSVSSVSVIIRLIYWKTNCTQCSLVFTMGSRIVLQVYKINPYYRCENAQEANAIVEGTDRTTGWGYSDAG